MISALRESELKSYLKCDFKVSQPVLAGDVVKSGNPRFASSSTLTVLQSDADRIISMHNEWRESYTEYFRQGERPDARREQIALEGARKLIDFITGDYGDLLYSLGEGKTTESEKREAIRGFFDNNKAKIQGWFAQMDQNYAHVSLMNKVSMLISLKDMYAEVAEIEKKVAASTTVTLDRFIRSSGSSRP
jgi:hypothetical protein